jgi:hypothetical protein
VLNPLELRLSSINTNTYLIGLSMILLNLGGRHISMGLTAAQDKFFQNQYIRPFMLFVVIFVATRNILTALWLSIGIMFTIGCLLNEHSSFYLFGEPVPAPPPPSALGPMPKELTADEQEIYKRLHEKVERLKREQDVGGGGKKEKEEEGEPHDWYKSNMKSLRELLGMSS